MILALRKKMPLDCCKPGGSHSRNRGWRVLSPCACDLSEVTSHRWLEPAHASTQFHHVIFGDVLGGGNIQNTLIRKTMRIFKAKPTF